jgi:hypothetical protein
VLARATGGSAPLLDPALAHGAPLRF